MIVDNLKLFSQGHQCLRDVTPETGWAGLVTALSTIPSVTGVAYWHNLQSSLHNPERVCGDFDASWVALMTLVGADLTQNPDDPVMWPGGPSVWIIPVWGFAQHYGWIGLGLADTISMHDTSARLLARQFSMALGLWADKHQLYHEARKDSLTGMHNRVAFFEQLSQALARPPVEPEIRAVGIVDFDNFKSVNDTYGHDIGDQLLQRWAQRLAVWEGTDRYIARIGGDEFAFWLEGFSDIATLETFLEQWLTAMTEPIGLVLPGGMNIDVQVQASVGLTLVNEVEMAADSAFRQADLALYRVKAHKEKRDRPWVWYKAPPTQTSLYQSYLPHGIRVHYQPIVDVHTGHVHSLEALVRLWNGNRLLAPGQFLVDLTADEMEQLTFAVLDQVLTDIGIIDTVWNTHELLSISLNLEPSMLSPDCIRRIGQRVQQASVSPERITLELLETSDFLSQAVARHQLQVLKEKRFQLALDDVGSAYSSLLRIKELPIDTLKLDQAFVRHIPDHPDDLLFVIAMQTLARGFNAHFVAEGVETTDILNALQVLGVDRIQGYVFTRPLPLDELMVWGREYVPVASDGRPHSLLGAYAAHLAYQFLDRVIPDPDIDHQRAAICPLTRYFESTGAHNSLLAREHTLYHDQWRTNALNGNSMASFKDHLLRAMSPTPDETELVNSR